MGKLRMDQSEPETVCAGERGIKKEKRKLPGL